MPRLTQCTCSHLWFLDSSSCRPDPHFCSVSITSTVLLLLLLLALLLLALLLLALLLLQV
jgi:hypothetical protein